MSSLLEVRNLRVETVASPVRELLRGVSFDVRAGKTTCLVGASGSGKSLSCLSVPGLLPHGVRRTGGEIYFRGSSSRNSDRGDRIDSPETMKSLRGSVISMVMQNPMSCFDPVFSIENHFRETLRAHGFRGRRAMDEKIAAALAEVGFKDDPKIRHAYPFQLSGGMLQRIMLAIALMLDPELLIADEATSDLDTVAQARVLDLIDEARQRRRMGVLLVTHDFGVVARMADYVLVMEDGEVVERGPVASLFEHPSHDCTKALLVAHGKLSAHMAEEERAV